MKILNYLIAGLAVAGLSGCAVGPNYVRPKDTVPTHYKAEALGSWKEGQPLDHVPKGTWWEVFADESLGDLEERAAAANQELKAAVARVDQARAIARIARSEFFPTVEANPSWRRERFSPNQEPNFGGVTVNTFRVPL